jgi:uncharacterized protein (TIGR02300 family)
MTTASELRKALRGTKRVCESCEVSFYDLAREPIVCPSCGARFTPAAQLVEAETRAAPLASKTWWRRKAFRLPDPLPEADPERSDSRPAPAIEEDLDETDTPTESIHEDDTVLDEEPDGA